MTTSDQASAKHVMNKPTTLVSESIEGLCYANPHLRILKEERVVYYDKVDEMAKRQVTIISGGGSGHEPGYAGMVGENCLAANVCGHVFASPSSSQVLAAIERVQSPHGTLVIIMNYTGDCLNFGLAVERAKARGIRVDLIAVGDDIAVGRSKGGKVGRRGMAATALAIKLAGALAAKGASLEKVRAITQYAIDHAATLGVAFDHCHVPGSSSVAHLQPDELELGMGIHNETGFLKTHMMPAHDLVQKMMAMLLDQNDKDRAFLKLEPHAKVVLLVNNLGGTAMVELNVVVKEAVEYIMGLEVQLVRVYTGPFVTSLNMPGFSISLMVVDDHALELLDMPVKVAAWPLTAALCFNKDVAETKTVAKENLGTEITISKGGAAACDPKVVEAAILGATNAVIEAEPRITEYDTVLGDGDCGQTLKTAALAIQKALPSYDLSSGPRAMLGIADTIERSVGGTSSAIYCIFFNAFASGLNKQVDGSIWVYAARHALATLMTYTKARVGDRTLMDTLCPFVDTLNDEGSNLKEAIQKATEGAMNTRDLSAKLGRSSYLSNKEVMESGIPDAGAYGLSELLNGLAKAL